MVGGGRVFLLFDRDGNSGFGGGIFRCLKETSSGDEVALKSGGSFEKLQFHSGEECFLLIAKPARIVFGVAGDRLIVGPAVRCGGAGTKNKEKSNCSSPKTSGLCHLLNRASAITTLAAAVGAVVV